MCQEGTRADSLQFLMDGKVSISGDGIAAGQIEPPAAIAFDEVLEGSPVKETVRTIDAAICLDLNSDEFLTLLSNNSPIVQGLFRMQLGHSSAARLRQVIKTPGHARTARPVTETLTSIEKAIALQDVPIFSRATADHLVALAAIARQLPFTTEGRLLSEGDRPAIYIVLAGRLALDPPAGGESVSAGPGDIVGMYEILSGDQMGWRTRTIEPGAVLRLDRDELFDLLADNVDLLQGIFSALLRARTVASVAAAGR